MIELTNEQIEQIKKIELEIFSEFIEICNKLKINYYIVGGTLLGAVRHKGFIPWDDDIDVALLRKDYEVFKKNAPKMFSKKMFFQHYSTDTKFPLSFIKIRRNDTEFIEESMKNFSIHHGVFIDVFPLDYYPDNKIKRFFVNFINQCFKKRINIEMGIGNNNMLSKIVGKILKVIFPRYQDAVIKRDKYYIRLSKKYSKNVVNFSGAWGLREIVPTNCFKNITLLQFEDKLVSAPVNYNTYLNTIYGDYMKLPPEKDQHPHHYVYKISL